MADYYEESVHPKTGCKETARWADDCFGKHRFGVIFPYGSAITREEVAKVERAAISRRGGRTVSGVPFTRTTDEPKQRVLKVKGAALLDGDFFVASFEDGTRKSAWTGRHNGTVIRAKLSTRAFGPKPKDTPTMGEAP